MMVEIRNYIILHHGNYEVFPAPFAVFLYADDKTYVEPDISVICDKNKLDDRGCNGAPDWIINPQKSTVMVYDLEKEEKSNQYGFDDEIPVWIYEDFRLRILDFV